MQKYVSAGLEIYPESAQTVLIYLVETDLETGEKTILANAVIRDRSDSYKLEAGQINYAQVQQNALTANKTLKSISEFTTAENLYFNHFLAFRNTDARVSILDAGYNWLLRNHTQDLEEPDLQIVDDRYEIYAKAKRTAGPLGKDISSRRPRRSSQNYKVWI